jgi:hypothetical protein
MAKFTPGESSLGQFIRQCSCWCPRASILTADGSAYDLSTYWGRVRHFFDMVDPRNTLVTDAELTKSQALLSHYRAHGTRAISSMRTCHSDPRLTLSGVGQALHRLA